MSLKNEYKLIIQAKDDFSAFAKIYTHYQPSIFAYCLNRLTNKESAEDITSQVFLAFIDRINDFEHKEGATIGSWLYRVAHNKIIDHFRSAKVNKRAILEPDLHLSDSRTEQLAEVSEHQKQVAFILATLKDRYQEVLSLRFYAELSNEEISRVTGLKKDQVPVVIHRALKSFKKKYSKKFPESEIY